MRYSKEITVNIGNYENVRFGVSDCESFQDADAELDRELERLGLRSRVVKPEVSLSDSMKESTSADSDNKWKAVDAKEVTA